MDHTTLRNKLKIAFYYDLKMVEDFDESIWTAHAIHCKYFNNNSITTVAVKSIVTHNNVPLPDDRQQFIMIVTFADYRERDSYITSYLYNCAGTRYPSMGVVWDYVNSNSLD